MSPSGGRRTGGQGGGRPRRGGRPPVGGRGGRPPVAGRPPRSVPGGAPGRPVKAPRRGLGGEQVEGRQAVRELLLAGRRRVREVVLATDLDRAPVLDDIRQLAAEARVPVREVSRLRLDAQARTEAPQGVTARAAPLPEADLDDLVRQHAGRAPFLLALDGVTDPGNLGALLRTAEGAGVTGVVLPRHRSVHVTPAVTKAAAGAIEHLPMAVVGGLPAALTRIGRAGLWVVGFDEGGDRSAWESDLGDGAVAVVLGAEGTGLGRLTRQRCDEVALIPLKGRLSSLNVAAAGAVACFEIARRRAASGR